MEVTMNPRRSALALSSLLLTCLILAACGGSSKGNSTTSTSSSSLSGTINVFAAASLTSAFEQLGKDFMAENPGVTVRFNFAGSSTLATQIQQGAPVDVFASADTTNMDKVAKDMNASKTFATNSLIVIVPANNPGNIQTLKDLANPGVKIAVAEQSVPVGNYTTQVLDKMAASSEYGPSYKTAVEKNFVTHETSVGGIVSKVELGEVDAGYVYVTDALESVPKVSSIEIPDQYNITADYPIATGKSSSNSAAAEAFVNFVLSSDGQGTLQSFGFDPA
jgi:molybdate transport system substrate-binding protein